MNGPHLLADIGGTYARFAMRWEANDGQTHYANTVHLQVRDHASLADAVERYLEGVELAHWPQAAVIAVASAVNGDQIQFSNSAWRFSIAELGSRLRLRQVEVVNDFAAVAWALPELRAEDVQHLGGPPLIPFTPGQVQLALGPGTGLGLAAVKRTEHGPVVIDSEAGHSGFAPRDDLERRIHADLSQRFGRVSYERILSGAGLVNLYCAMARIEGSSATLERPEQVSLAARRGEPLALQCVQRFCSVFGSFAGDSVLNFGAWSGAYLAGEMLSHLFDASTIAIFRQAFEDKGRFSAQLAKVPTLRVIRPDVGLLGVATLSRTAL